MPRLVLEIDLVGDLFLDFNKKKVIKGLNRAVRDIKEDGLKWCPWSLEDNGKTVGKYQVIE